MEKENSPQERDPYMWQEACYDVQLYGLLFERRERREGKAALILNGGLSPYEVQQRADEIDVELGEIGEAIRGRLQDMGLPEDFIR